jgi:hypothetical protein
VARFLGCLLAAWLIAPQGAFASLILEPPEEVLVRTVTSIDPTPAFGPKFHWTRGPEILSFAEPPEESSMGVMVPLAALCISFALGVLWFVPWVQRVLLMVKLLD